MLRNSANMGVHLYEVRVFGSLLVQAADRPERQNRSISVNGGSGQIVIRADGDHRIDIYTISGRLVRFFNGNSKGTFRLGADSMKPGVYCVSLGGNGMRCTRRLVIK
jgi:hypothetical protein